MTTRAGSDSPCSMKRWRIPAIRYLPGYMNTAQRALKDLIAVMPDRSDVLDAKEVLETITGGQKD